MSISEHIQELREEGMWGHLPERCVPLLVPFPASSSHHHLDSLTTGKGNRFVLANTEDLHEKIQQLALRVRTLEDALAESHSLNDPHNPHPLLANELLQIKRPLERERKSEPNPVPVDEDTKVTTAAMGSLFVHLPPALC